MSRKHARWLAIAAILGMGVASIVFAILSLTAFSGESGDLAVQAGSGTSVTLVLAGSAVLLWLELARISRSRPAGRSRPIRALNGRLEA